jgi:TonB-dependent receptor
MLRRLLIPALLIALPYALFSQGIIKGVVIDSVDKKPLLGANVMLLGTALGAATDLKGNYTIAKVPPGRYSLRVTYIGYKSKTLIVEAKEGEIVQVPLGLQLDAIEGGTVVVTAQALGQAGAINRQLTSRTITNVVSAEKIMELPDANAAESVGRLPGISIQRSGGEGNKVVIRGLSPTYNAITIAGDRIPATDLDDRSVDLSMIAPEILAGIEVTKALTPDKDADALGGTVDFQLTTAPSGGFKFNSRFQNGFNQQRHEFGEYRGRIVVSNRLMDERLGILLTGNMERTQRGSDQFQASYMLAREKRPEEQFAPITTAAVTFEHTYDIRKRYGFNIMLDYLIPGGKLLFNNFLSRLDRDELVRTRRFDMSGSNKIKYYLRDRQRQIDIMTNSLAGEHDWAGARMDWRVARSSAMTRYPYNSRFQFEEANAFNTANIPTIAAPEDLINNAFNRVANAYLYDGEFEPERSYERDLAAQLNIEMPYTLISNMAGKIKGGVKFREKKRDRDRDYASSRLDKTDSEYGTHHSLYGTPGFMYERMPGTGYAYMKYYLDPQFDAGRFLNGEYDFGVGLDAVELDHFLNSYLYDDVYRFSLQRDMDDYNITDRLGAAYLMTELNIGRLVKCMPGVRYESSVIDAMGKSGIVNNVEDEGLLDDERVQDTTAVVKYSNVFPMIHLRFLPSKWFDVRLAFTKSISYPRMDYIIPSQKIKGSSFLVEYGNPLLKPQLSTNYDLYLSWYGNRLGLITLGGFAKTIDHLIYVRSGHMIIDPDKEGVDKNLKGYTITRPENNPYQTKVRGFELEWQTNFKWLPRPFDGIVINANYSHIWSETNFPRSYVKQERLTVFPFLRTSVIDTFRTGNMPDQAADIANLSLGYDLGRFSGRISMLLQGKTLSYIGVREELDGFTSTYIRWDLSLKYDVTKTIGLFCNVNNLTNQPDESFMQTARYATSREYYGFTSDMGLTLKL